MPEPEQNGTRTLQAANLPLDLYFRMEGLRAKLKATTWQRLFETLVEHEHAIITLIGAENGGAATSEPATATK